ncbi:hypothetical protein [Exiguobacterium artemiae]|uniref:hypothetical protein n=1 Tax=Exiguobacterium artemiae TaxID=340145 RepID=UPI003D021BC0
MDAINIIFVCESGLVSSVMGAKVLRDRLQKERLHVTVEMCRAKEIPRGTNFLIGPRQIVSHLQLDSACRVFAVDHLLAAASYDDLIDTIRNELMQSG